VRVLHLFANWKWTGPAEPAVNLAAALAQRGHEVTFVSGRPIADLPDRISEEAAARGLPVLRGLELSKHTRPLANRRDATTLARWLAEIRPDLLHCHTLNDHLVAARATRLAGASLPIVRSLYDGAVPRKSRRNRLALTRRTAMLLSASERVRRDTTERFGVPEDRTRTVEGAVDLARFDPRRPLPDLRVEFGIEPQDFVLGIVARMQPRRRFDVFFDALDRASVDVPRLRVLMVGRGTHMEKVAVERARRSLLGQRIVFTGYRSGDEYVATLRALHAKVFLWPGSDGSCRAVREAMAMGVPVLAARVGMLDEIVTDGEDGILLPHDPEALAHAVRRLALGLAERDEMAAGALATAKARFDLVRQAEHVEGAYRAVLSA
jgi:glycosyltransferase involved in cell wall biosynthesis